MSDALSTRPGATRSADAVRSMTVSAGLRLVGAVARASAMERIRTSGPFFYALVWMCPALFGSFLVVFIYRDAPALRDYAIVGGAGIALLFGMQFNAGQILDEQRQDGTLGNLFVSPGPRCVWLAASSSSRRQSPSWPLP